MKIVSGKAEKRELERCERSRKSELVCVYGRRRVGKTFLVEQTFAGYFAFRATGVEGGNTRQQLKSFNQRLQEHGDGVTDICEMKFTDRPFAISADYEADLLNKVETFRDETGTGQALKLVMVSVAGISGVAHTERISRVLTIDDLFE